VWLAPGAVTWVDLLLPADDGRWDPDVGRSAHWLGEVWAGVLADLGRPGAEVHRGRLVASPWSDLICFAGLGPGEVRWQGRKVVGISQRRTRLGARFQCALLHRWDPDPLLDVLALDDRARARARADLASVAIGVPVSSEAVAVALHRRLVALDP
jgi:lipoate-protein ligase A